MPVTQPRGARPRYSGRDRWRIDWHAHAPRRPRRRGRRGRLGRCSSRSTSGCSRAYDDVELLGKAVTRGRRGPSPARPCTSPTARSSAPSTRTSRRACPLPAVGARPGRGAGRERRACGRPARSPTASTRARDELPAARRATRAAFAQATWRHLLFGVVLGELERRLNRGAGGRAAGLRAPARPTARQHRARRRRRPRVVRRLHDPRARDHRASRPPYPTRLTARPAATEPAVLITGASGFAGGHLVARPARRRATTSSACRARRRKARAPGGRPPRRRGRAGRRARRSPTSSTTSPRWPRSGGRGRRREPLPGRERALDLQPARGGARRGARAPRGDRGLGRGYGPPASLPVDEDAPLHPQTPYAVSKASRPARRLLRRRPRAADHPRARVQPRRPGQAPTFAVASFARQVAAGLDAGDDPVRVVTGAPDTRRDFTDVRDVVRAYRLLGRARRRPGPTTCARAAPASAARDRRAARPTSSRRRGRARRRPGAACAAHEVLEVRGSAGG